ncbi:MAG TPA: hypothetical protein VJ739_12555 [Gemmataceae bacterium]|nr:hypothetical protein [Gemmataceae bacterium]
MPLPEAELDRMDSVPTPAEEEALVEEAPRVVLSGEEALAKLRAGEVIVNARIVRLTFRGAFPLPVRLRRVVLVQPRFDGATFRGEASFQGCTLDRPTFGRPTEFAGGLDLTGSTLLRVQLHRVTVRGPFNCDNVLCRGRFLVNACRFEGGTRFWQARFAGWAEFRGCAFPAGADFRSLHAEEGFILLHCRFGGDALFRGATVCKKLDATGSRFEALLDFSKAKLHDYVYLEGVEQGPGQRFAFANALGERVSVRTEQLAGRLASEGRGDYRAAMQEYAFLKRAFQVMHRYDQEDWAYYRFKVSQRRGAGRSWWRPWTRLFQFADWLLLDQGCGYCTDPFRAVRTAALIILGFAAVYVAGIDHFYFVHVKLPFDGGPEAWPNRVAVGLFKSVVVFTSGLSSLGDMARGWMNLPLIVESLLGTLLWGLFIVAFSRKVIR